MRKLTFIFGLVAVLGLVLLLCLAVPGIAQEDLGSLPPDAQMHSSAVTTTVTFQQGLSPDPSYMGVADTYIDNNKRVENFGDRPEVRINYDGRQKILLRFDLSEHVPTSAVVTAARLELYGYYTQFQRQLSVGVFSLLRSWSEDQTTWDEPWEVSGCEGDTDRESEHVAAATLRYSNTWQVWESDQLRELVQQWVEDPAGNHGMVLIGLLDSESDWWDLRSSDYGATPPQHQQRPRLIISYELPPPTPTPTATRTSTPVVTGSSVAGIAWRDDNRNRSRDPAEPPMSGVTIRLKDPGGRELGQRVTQSDGSYKFDGLNAGNYALGKTDPAGHDCTHPPGGAYAFSLGVNQQLTGLDFGFALPASRTPTSTPTRTPTGTVLPTNTPTRTATPTHTPPGMPTWTPTVTPLFSPTPTATATHTSTPIITATSVPSPSPTEIPQGTLEDPIPVVCERLYSGDTADFSNNIEDYGLCGGGLTAPEIIYALYVTYPLDYVSITLDSQAALALFVLSGPNATDCIWMGGAVTLPNVVPGTYYIVVDGFMPGAYGMEIHCYPLTPGSPTPTRTLTPTTTVTPGPSPTLTATVTGTVQPSPTLTATVTGTVQASPTPTATGTAVPSATPQATRTPGGPVKIYFPLMYRAPLEFFINCGTGGNYVDLYGRRWLADREYTPGDWGFVGSTAPWSTGRAIEKTEDDRLYQTQRYGAGGSFGYRFDVPNGRYRVELHFAEIYSQFDKPGNRIFDVLIEGQPLLNNLDVVDQAGGQFTALRTIHNAQVYDEQLNITFAHDWVNGVENPIISAMGVVKLD